MKDSKFVEPMMDHDDVAAMVLSAKRSSGMTWEELAAKIGMSPVWTHSCCMGMNSMPRDKAELVVATLGLPQEAALVLTEAPNKVFEQTIPTDPCVYRLYEIMGTYGHSMKALIHEKFGDGIMSAIDFDMEVNRVEDPKGDRVQVVMSGKYLPYKDW